MEDITTTNDADHDRRLCKLGCAVITLCSFCDHGRGWRLNHPCTSSQSETMPSPPRFSMRTIAQRPPTRQASAHRALETHARGFLGPGLFSAGVCTGTFLSECIALQSLPDQCLVVSPWLVQTIPSPANHVTALPLRRKDRTDPRPSCLATSP